MIWLAKALGLRAVRWGLIAVISTGFGYWGIHTIKNVMHRASQTEIAEAARAAAVQVAVDQKIQFEAEQKRLEADRIAKDSDQLVFRNNARSEAGRLKKQVEELKDVKKWYEANVPPSISELYHSTTPSRVHSPEDNTEGSD